MTYSLVTGVLFGLYFAVLAMGLTLAFGIAHVVNLAHGDFVVIGALCTGLLFRHFALNPIVSAFILLIVFIAWGPLIYYLFVKPIDANSEDDTISLIIFFGVSELIESLLLLLIGPSPQSIPLTALGIGSVTILDAHIPGAWLYTGGLSLVVIAVSFVVLYRTSWGRIARAVMCNSEEATSIGIDSKRITIIVLGLALGLAAVAGAVTPFMLGSVTVSSGLNLTLSAFLVSVLGTIGNPLGTVLASLIFGIALALVQNYFSSWANVFPYAILILILLIRPNGLLGRRARHV